MSDKSPPSKKTLSEKRKNRSALEQFQRERKRSVEDEDVSSEKQRRKKSSGSGTSQRNSNELYSDNNLKGPNSDETTPLVAQSSHNSTQGPTCLVQNGKRKNSRSALEESQRKRKNNGKNEDDSSQKQRTKISSGPGTSQRKGPNSDDPTPLVAQSSHDSTQGPTCLVQNGKRKNSSSAPEQFQRKRKNRGKNEDDSSEEDVSFGKKSQRINSGPEESQNEGNEPYSDNLLREELQRKYIQLDCLGAGGNGSVYAGYRRDDKLPVAIKHIPISNVVRTAMAQDGVQITFPWEALVMFMAGQIKDEDRRRFSVALLNYYELQDELVLVMERPTPSQDLFCYTLESVRPLNEDEAKVILRQLVEGMIHILSNGVLHCDIKPENILIQTMPEGPRLHILDFGNACTAREGPYTQAFGTATYTPPEWYLQSSYQAVPYTVWQVGLVLYFMLCGKHAFYSTTQIISEELNVPDELSQECKDLLRRCLAKQPEERPSLDSMLKHPWFTHA